MALTPQERSLRARIGAYALHGQHDSRELTAPARVAFLSSFHREAIQAAAERGEELTEAEVERRAEHLKKAHFARMALASSRARRRKAS